MIIILIKLRLSNPEEGPFRVIAVEIYRANMVDSLFTKLSGIKQCAPFTCKATESPSPSSLV